MTFRWCVEESDTGLPVAMGTAETEVAAHNEMMRYAVQYAQDGEVRFWMRRNRKTVTQGSLLLKFGTKTAKER
jgi:hypothetical protein